MEPHFEFGPAWGLGLTGWGLGAVAWGLGLSAEEVFGGAGAGAGLGWAGQGWVGLGRVGLGWAGLGAGCGWAGVWAGDFAIGTCCFEFCDLNLAGWVGLKVTV